MKVHLGVFFDDILVYNRNQADHVEHLSLVLQTLGQNQLFAKKSKCCFAMAEIGYLGHVISGFGVATDPQKIAAVVNGRFPPL